MTLFFWLLLGLLVGSFANVCIQRIPLGQSIVRPASRCPQCLTPLRWRDNIPLLSYAFLKGRCRWCHLPIPWTYPAIEATMALLFATVFWRYSHRPVMLAAGGVLTLFLLVMTVIDLSHQIIPDLLTLGLFFLGLSFSPINPLLGEKILGRLFQSGLGGLIGFFLMLLIAWLGKIVWKKEALGGGDIKLMASLGLLLGWKGVFFTLLAGSLAGTVMAGTLLLCKKIGRGSYIPFGPFLAFGAWCYWLQFSVVTGLF